ncbi:hypothetical protein [Pedobacter paludis]|uniref:Uncharacterized protein n=1 Tax=Pedobacter paludis TaxID=2203212 RepID=A0A317F0H6_9SPHI|nr:hypothetical protein [Pedobacter paludis]PWS32265.1 hypothetical protein DF947_10885 [Pedobacter paludis]
MNSYHFNIYPFDSKQAQDCIVHFDSGIYHVHVEGKKIGVMVKNRNEEFAFQTDDKELMPLLEEISGNLHELQNRATFKDILLKKYSEILSAEFTDQETLALTLSDDTDLGDFASCLSDVIYDDVEFDEHLNVILSNISGDEVRDIQIN